MEKKIFHIYFGTQGNSGLYLDEIYQALAKKKINQQVFVSYYFPFEYGNKVFFKYTDLTAGKKRNKFTLYLRYLELIRGLFFCFCSILRYRPTIVNYSLISTYFPEYAFLKILHKYFNLQLIITCHDVYPFHYVNLDASIGMKRRMKIFRMANYLLVHNSNSKVDLLEFFHIDISKVIIHPFPIMDLKKIYKNEILSTEKQYDFLFIGHLRREKGVFILLNAWKKFHQDYPQASLLVAGNISIDSNLDVEDYKDLNIEFELRYLSDNDYCKLIQMSKCVVLPYLRGTNCGVVSTVLSLGTQVVTSDIPMFRNNELINEDSMFISNNENDLRRMLQKKMQVKVSKHICLNNYRKTFRNQVFSVYENLLNG